MMPSSGQDAPVSANRGRVRPVLVGLVLVGLLAAYVAWNVGRNRSEERQLQLAAEALVRFVGDTARFVAPSAKPVVLQHERQGCGAPSSDQRVDYWVKIGAKSRVEVLVLRDAVIRRWRSLDLDSYYAASNGDLEVRSDGSFGAYVGAGPERFELWIEGSTDCFHP
jgi:hypothetical protein